MRCLRDARCDARAQQRTAMPPLWRPAFQDPPHAMPCPAIAWRCRWNVCGMRRGCIVKKGHREIRTLGGAPRDDPASTATGSTRWRMLSLSPLVRAPVFIVAWQRIRMPVARVEVKNGEAHRQIHVMRNSYRLCNDAASSAALHWSARPYGGIIRIKFGRSDCFLSAWVGSR